MRYSGIQPQYFPRLHYFARILNTDIFVLRNEVQFVRKHKYPDGKNGKSYQAHTPIKQSFGLQLLAVTTKHDGFTPINKTEVSYDQDWVADHIKTLEIAYAHAPNLKLLLPEIKMIVQKKYKNIADLNIATILWGLLKILGEKKIDESMITIEYVEKKLEKSKKFRLKKIRKASESLIAKNTEVLTPNEKIIRLCREFGIDEDYCGGTAMNAYMDFKLFEENGIKLTLQDWKCREYPQLYTKQQGFIPNLSILDLLLNCSDEEITSVIKG